MVSISIEERWKPSQSLSLIDYFIIIRVKKVRELLAKMKVFVVFHPFKWVDKVRDILQQMLEEEDFQEMMFLKKKKKDISNHINAEQIHRPTTQISPFFDRLMTGVCMRMDETTRKLQMITNKFYQQSHETGKLIILNHQAASRFLCGKFENACSLGVSLASHQSQSNEINKDNQDIKSAITILQQSQLRNCSSILKQHQQKKLYAKRYLIHNHKCAKFFSKHPKLFNALTDNLQGLMDYLQSNNTREEYLPKLDHVLPFRLIKAELEKAKSHVKEQNRWTLKYYSQAFVMIMDRGDNCLQSPQIEIHIHNKNHPFQINNYLSDNQQDVLQYFLQVCRALNELIQHRIYHMDMEPRNIIPIKNKQGKIEYKIIDFEMALFLNQNEPKVSQSLNQLWVQTADCWKNHDVEVLQNLFQQMLCRNYNLLSQFDIITRAPGHDLYEYLFVRQPNAEEFIKQLFKYMECYYRNALLKILSLIMEKSKWLTANQKTLMEIIIRQPFQDIDKSIQSMWDNHF